MSLLYDSTGRPLPSTSPVERLVTFAGRYPETGAAILIQDLHRQELREKNGTKV